MSDARVARRARSSWGARERIGALARVAGRHAPFVVVLGTGIVLRGLVLVAYQPSLPFRNKDPYAYLERAISMSPEGSYHPFLYPVILKPFLLAGAFPLVTVTQHLAALATGVTLYALLRRFGVGAWLAAVGAAPVLLDGYQLAVEHQIFSETFFELFAVTGLAVLTWNRTPSWWAVAVSGFVLGIAPLVRFTGLALVPAVLLYAAARRIGWARLAVLAAAVAVPLLTYATWFKTETGSFALTNRNGFYLYGRVASFADCRRVPVPSDERVFCPDRLESKPGRGLFKAGLPRRILRDPSYNDRAGSFARRMIRAMPERFVAAIAADLARYVGPREGQDFKKWRFPRHVGPRDRRHVPAGMHVRFRMSPRLASPLRAWQQNVSLYGPLLGALVALGLVGGLIGLLAKSSSSLGPETSLFALAALGLMIFPTVFAVYHFRYSIPVIPFAGAAGALGAHVTFGWLESLRWRRRSSSTPTGNPNRGTAA